MSCFEAENIRDWHDYGVVDPDGSKIGQLEAVYVDTGTDAPAFLADLTFFGARLRGGRRRPAR